MKSIEFSSEKKRKRLRVILSDSEEENDKVLIQSNNIEKKLGEEDSEAEFSDFDEIDPANAFQNKTPNWREDIVSDDKPLRNSAIQAKKRIQQTFQDNTSSDSHPESSKVKYSTSTRRHVAKDNSIITDQDVNSSSSFFSPRQPSRSNDRQKQKNYQKSLHSHHIFKSSSSDSSEDNWDAEEEEEGEVEEDRSSNQKRRTPSAAMRSSRATVKGRGYSTRKSPHNLANRFERRDWVAEREERMASKMEEEEDSGDMDDFIVKSDEDDEDEVEQQSVAKEGDVAEDSPGSKRIEISEDEDEEVMDGPLMYWQMNAKLDQQKNRVSLQDTERENEEWNDYQSNIFCKNFSIPQAMTLYIEKLSYTLIDEKFPETCRNQMNSAKFSSYMLAEKQIENLICINRESLLGSVWKQDFLTELQTRPFYVVYDPDSVLNSFKCHACNRTSKSYEQQIYLYGCRYDAKRIWTVRRWENELPKEFFLFHAQKPPSMSPSVPPLTKQSSMAPLLTKQSPSSGPFLSQSTSASSYEVADDQLHDASEEVVVLQKKKPEVEVIILSDDDDDDGSMSTTIEHSSSMYSKRTAWWLIKYPQEFVLQEEESSWILSVHCKNRTQLYHTLIHYKFRLLLKIREKLLNYRQNYQKLHELNKEEWLDYHKKLLQRMLDDKGFMESEIKRFEQLIRQVSIKYGRSEEQNHNHDVWSDDERTHYPIANTTTTSTITTMATNGRQPSRNSKSQKKINELFCRSSSQQPNHHQRVSKDEGEDDSQWKPLIQKKKFQHKK